MSNEKFIWSDNWWIDEDQIWLMAANYDILFCMDRKTMVAKAVDVLPVNAICGFRQHPGCIKHNDVIFCMPNKVDNIYCYHITNCTWKQIPMQNPRGIELALLYSFKYGNYIFAVSHSLKQIIELNMETEQIEQCYSLPMANDEVIGSGILVDYHIYIVSSTVSCIFEFDCLSKTIKTYHLQIQDDNLYSIGFDGKNFWLTGERKRIYVWNKERNGLKCLDDFPSGFGIYDSDGLLDCNTVRYYIRTFKSLVFVGRYIWFIPFETNKILYVDKESFEIKEFKVFEENETENTFQKHFVRTKYLVEYIDADRYIGLFSVKNRWIIEIDAVELTYKILKYTIDDVSAKLLHQYRVKEYFFDGIAYEQSDITLKDMIKYIESKEPEFLESQKREDVTVGRQIYQEICG